VRQEEAVQQAPVGERPPPQGAMAGVAVGEPGHVELVLVEQHVVVHLYGRHAHVVHVVVSARKQPKGRRVWRPGLKKKNRLIE